MSRIGKIVVFEFDTNPESADYGAITGESEEYGECRVWWTRGCKAYFTEAAVLGETERVIRISGCYIPAFNLKWREQDYEK